MKINMKHQAYEFLRNHGWNFNKEFGYWYHPLFPLGEDLSTEELVSKFVNGFYKEAWITYLSLVNFYAKGISEKD